MRISVLDRASLGMDTPLEALSRFGEVEIFDSTLPELVADRAAASDVIIINKVKITREVLVAAPRLRLVCVFATGYDNVDVEAARELGVAVCNVPGYSTDSVALFTVVTALTLYSHLGEYNDYVKSGEYTESGVPNRLVPVYHDLAGKTWGIIGYGNIGRAVGRVAEAFGARVIACKRTPTDEVKCIDINTLCRESDIITIHCPLNDRTRGIINKERIALMKPSVVIVNEARGAVVCEADIAEAIETGRVAAFGCDVYSTEPFGKDHPYARIMNRKNVLLTPHAAWGAYEARARCISIIADNIQSFLEGKILNRVDKLGQ